MDKYVIAPPSGSNNNSVGAADAKWKEGHFEKLPNWQDYLTESTGYGIVSGCEPTINNLTVTVGAGVVHLADGTRKEIAQTNITLDAADGTNPRIDLVYIDSTGTVAKVTGTAATSPSAPTLPSNGISVCTVSVAANATTGTVTDMRGMLPRFYNTGIVNVKDFGAVGDGVHDDTEAIQAAIDSNPNATIFIPNGTFLLSESLKVSGRLSKCVFIVMSNDAFLKADDAFTDDFVVEFGYEDSVTDDGFQNRKQIGIKNGVIDCNERASGILLRHASAPIVEDFIIRNCADTGVQLLKSTDAGMPLGAIVRNVAVIAPDHSTNSTAVAVYATDNTFINIRSTLTFYGMRFFNSSNLCFGCHPVCSSSSTENWEDSIGFDVKADNVVLESCYADNYSTGFNLGKTHGTLKNCYTYWYSNTNHKHICIRAMGDGALDSVIDSFRVDFPSQGSNYVLYPITDGNSTGDISNYTFSPSPNLGRFTNLQINTDSIKRLAHPVSEFATLGGFSGNFNNVTGTLRALTADKWVPVAVIMTGDTGYTEMTIKSLNYLAKVILKIDMSTFTLLSKNIYGDAQFQLGLGKINDVFADIGLGSKSVVLYAKAASVTGLYAHFDVTISHSSTGGGIYHYPINAFQDDFVSGFYNITSIPNQIGGVINLY